MATLIALLCAVAALAALLGGAALLVAGDARIEARLAGRGTGLGAQGPRLPRLDAQPLLRGLMRLGERAGRGALEPEKVEALRARLVHAGFHAERAPKVFFGVRAAAALGCALLALLAALLLHQRGLGLILTLGVGANLGLFGPNIWLTRRIADRAAALRQALPDVVDLMVVSVEAGSALGAALQRVTAEFADLYPIVGEQFGMMLMEMQAGASRAQALNRLARRAPGEETGMLAAMLIQSEAVGASVGATLRAFSNELRKSRHLEAERRASELPVKLAFPLVLCVFPAMSDILFAPVALQLMHVLHTHLK